MLIENIKNLFKLKAFIKDQNKGSYLSHTLENLMAEADFNQQLLQAKKIILWLYKEDSAQSFETRTRFLMQTLQKNEVWENQFQGLVNRIIAQSNWDGFFSEVGMAQTTLVAEVKERIVKKILPEAVVENQASEVVGLLFPNHNITEFKIDDGIGEYFFSLVSEENRQVLLMAMLDSLHVLGIQIQALLVGPKWRGRARSQSMIGNPINLMPQITLSLGEQLLQGVQPKDEIVILKEMLTQVEHQVFAVENSMVFDGVSLQLVFDVNSVKCKLHRMKMLLAFFEERSPTLGLNVWHESVQVHAGQQSLAQLVNDNVKMLVHTVTDRVAHTGEHYLVKDPSEFRTMLLKALGGGFVTAFTVYLKFLIQNFHLSPLLDGLLIGLNYGVSFLLIQYLGFTLGTKQPAMTAPYLARKMKELGRSNESALIAEFVAILRSQFVSVAGNVIMVVPSALVVFYALKFFTGVEFFNVAEADYTIHSLSVLSAAPLFAVFTGILLWLSSLFSGWVDNWMAYRRIEVRIGSHTAIREVLGGDQAKAWGHSLVHASSGIAANVSLALLLGLLPQVLKFIGIPLEIRHITLASGQLAGISPVYFANYEFGWAYANCLLGLLVIGFLNVTVSFYLALRLAAKAQEIEGVGVLRLFWLSLLDIAKNPLKFFFP